LDCFNLSRWCCRKVGIVALAKGTNKEIKNVIYWTLENIGK
jgi:hypothetical protein